jgi:MFS family permease
MRKMKSSSFNFSYTAFQVCFNLLFWVPVFYVYQKQFGLNDGQIFFIQSVYYITFCLFEIPTGWLADRWNLKSCLWAGGLILILCNLLPVFWPTYEGFMIHWILVALSRSLVSGASSAYLYTYLSQAGEARRYQEVEGRSRAYSLIAKVVAWIFVGALMKWHLNAPYWLSAVAAVLSTVAALSLPQTQPVAKRAFKISWQHPVGIQGRLFWIMLQGVSLFVLVRLCQVNLFQPLLLDKGFQLESFGMIMAAITVFEALGSWKPAWLRRWMSDEHGVLISCAGLAAVFLIFPFSGKIATLVGLGVFSLIAGVSFPIQKQLINDAIEAPHLRASILSFESILDRLACALVASLIGVFLSQNRLHEFFLGAGIITLGVSLLITWKLESACRTNQNIQKI